METTVCTFKLSVPFAQWVAIFDSEDVSKMHAAAGVTPLYRGVSTEDPSKVVVIHQAAPGVATKLMEDNKALIESSGRLETLKTSPGLEGIQRGRPSSCQLFVSIAEKMDMFLMIVIKLTSGIETGHCLPKDFARSYR